MKQDPAVGEKSTQNIPDQLPDERRREFLKVGLIVTGFFAGGTLISLISNAKQLLAPGVFQQEYPYRPHYAMIMRQDRCIGCERCVDACVAANRVPDYGWRTLVMERKVPKAIGQQREFVPILCNQCNNPPCVRTCPTRATFKDKTNGIIIMDDKKCIGCKSCMIACPYYARYYNEEKGAIDKCDFCLEAHLSQGKKSTACTEACPADVRIFGDLSDPGDRVYKMVNQLQRPVWVMREQAGAAPNVFYTKG